MSEELNAAGVAKPTIGRIVIYRSRTGEYEMPADVCATIDKLFRPNVEVGHVPDLSDDMHVHLIVKTPGMPGHVSSSTSHDHPELANPERVNKPFGGTYQEWNVPYDPDGAPGTWRWPARG